MIKAIFFDIDGTLVSFETHRIPESTMRTLQQLKDNGILLFIATGRSRDGLSVLEDFPFDGYVTMNGQYCYEQDGTVVYENTIAREALMLLKQELEKRPFPCGFEMPDGKIFNYRDERVDAVHAITLNDDQPAGDITGIEDKKVYQVMAFLNEEEEKEVMAKLPGCTSARWYPTFCDISPIDPLLEQRSKVWIFLQSSLDLPWQKLWHLGMVEMTWQCSNMRPLALLWTMVLRH